jgi:hypothetical protein
MGNHDFNYGQMESNYGMTPLQLGQAYDNLDADLKAYLDYIIHFGMAKIATIKFLRGHLGIGLTLSKILYEEREKFLAIEPHPMGW